MNDTSFAVWHEVVETPRSRNLWFELATMLLLTVGFLVALEGLFRVMKWGIDDPHRSILYYQRIAYPLFSPQRLADGREVFRADDARLGAQQFAVHKDPHTYRVFVFGGSAANGLGYSPNVRFSNFLEMFLREIYPEVNTEVINCGIIGFSTQQEMSLIEHISKNYEPDLLIVYSGNNEFLELHARMFVDKKLNARVLRAQDMLNRSNFYRSFRAAIQDTRMVSSSGGKVDADQFARIAFSESELVNTVRVTPAEYEFVLEKYRKNIREMVENAQGTPVLLSTVASNLRWNDPDDDAQADWLQDYLRRAGASEAEGKDRGAKLRAGLVLLQAELDKKPDLLNDAADAAHFRMAKIYEERGDLRQARQEYERARDLDKRSRRALGSFNQSISELGMKWSKRENLSVIDMEGELAQRTPNGIIGYETFYDYVHFSPLGAQHAAEVFARKIISQGLLEKRVQSAGPARVFDYSAYTEAYARDLNARSRDYPEAQRWIGFNDDKNAVISVNLFKYREGVATLTRMAEAGRKDPWIYTFLGNAKFHTGHEDAQALTYYREALGLAESSDHELRVAVLRNIGALLERQGRAEEARQYENAAQTLSDKKLGQGRLALDKILRFQ